MTPLLQQLHAMTHSEEHVLEHARLLMFSRYLAYYSRAGNSMPGKSRDQQF